MERSINKFLDAIDHLDFSQEYQVAYTISVVKTRLTANNEEIKGINDLEIFDSFEEENRIALIELILSTLKIIQDRCKANNRTQN